ncbi:MAG: hypothetical protein CMH54_00270 [Myxococcales bacterium]|nr:hypothetical protein [Myxococcales bacterium]|tara:strand:- start:861 stop:1124 length:264 start_codon:yes stop_codon:yes gene_type:complete
MRGFFTKFLFLLIMAAFAAPGCGGEKKKKQIPEMDPCPKACKAAFQASWSEAMQAEDKDERDELKATAREEQRECNEACSGGDDDEE